MVKYAAELMI